MIQETANSLIAPPEEAQALPPVNTSAVDYPQMPHQPRYGALSAGTDVKLKITIKGYDEPLIISLEQDQVLGRQIPVADGQVQIDLSPYKARENGVSRHHALISKDQDLIKVMDLKSTNGSFLNEARMLPFQPRILRDGDELRLGLLILQIKFV